MFTENYPPLSIMKKDGKWTVVETEQGIDLVHNNLKKCDSLEEAKSYVRDLIQSDEARTYGPGGQYSWYSFYRFCGYKGSQEDFIEFCSEVFDLDALNKEKAEVNLKGNESSNPKSD